MAAVAVPILEAAAIALARALGYGGTAAAGAAVVNEAAKKKAESIDKAKDKPIAQTEATSTTKPCTKCPPDCGTLVERNWNMSDDSRAYQARITGFAPYTEWSFESADFDGFRSQACLLLEAKAKYDQFFDEEGEPKLFFKLLGVSKIIHQSKRQSAVIQSSPPSQLQWHFMQPVSFKYFSKSFAKNLLPIQCRLTP